MKKQNDTCEEYAHPEECSREVFWFWGVVIALIVFWIAAPIWIYHCGYTQGKKSIDRKLYVQGYTDAWQKERKRCIK